MILEASLADAVGAEHVEAIDELSYRVVPGSAAEVAEVIRRAGAHRAAIHPVGAGGRAAKLPVTRFDEGRPRVMIATRRLDQVLQLDETSLLVHAQAGLTGLELERILNPRNLSIGDYPPVVLMSSLGGIIAVRTPGKSSARHGFFEDAVVGVSAVLADGRTVHTRVAPRRSTGPDLARALCGSEGTIGFITSAVLRIHQKPEARLVAAYILPSVDAAVSAVYLALREETAPSGLRIYDAAEAQRHFGGLQMSAGTALLCAATAGPTDLATCDRDLITSAVLAEGGRTSDHALAEIWWRRLHAGEPTPGPPPTLQVMATPSKVRGVYQRVISDLIANGANARAHISRFDADGAVLFFTFERSGAPADDSLLTLAARSAEAAGAWLLGARAHKLDLYLNALRDNLDPDRIMNPGALT
ncbi:MAG: FAD-binding oxidoreductase [Deltaproteobacteria bacterium]|nr:FAD-binding oxidoreductase [Deltaproteobacteria bacterium]MDQ3296514.1 FAD-binding oxidoreductase [Myxococcota bacterium]